MRFLNLLKKSDINRSDVSASRGDKTAREMLKTVLQNLTSLRYDAGDSASETEGNHLGSANEALKNVEVGIERLGSMAKDTINRLSGEDKH